MLQLLSTVMFVSILVTVPADHVTPIEVWALYWCSLVCWLAFAVTLRSSPRFSTAALITCLGFAVFAFGPSPDGTPVLLACIALAGFTSLPSVAASTIIWVFAAAAIIGPGGALLYGQGFLSLLGDLAALVVVALVGLNRRQHQVQARQAELLLEQHKLFQQEQARTAALDERARIAREIHDVLAHSLGALGVQLEVAEALLEDKGDVDGALLRVRRSRRLAHEGLAEARRAVAALRSDVPSLSDALDELAEDFRRDRQATVDFRIDGQPRPVSSATTVSLLRTAREALTNAASHFPRPCSVRYNGRRSSRLVST